MKLPRRRGTHSIAETGRHRQLGLSDGLPGLAELMDRLLGEDGCPWDREQTLESLRPYLLEECYEVLEAMGDPRSHRDELGDLLFQIVFAAALRDREGAFDLQDVIAGIRDKLIRRHPHVFAREDDAPPLTRDEVAAQWEAIKRAERETGSPSHRGLQTPSVPEDPLQAVPDRLPALIASMRLQQAASGVGFDWPSIDGALAKFREEWDEFEEARRVGTRGDLEDEYGDLLFVLVRIGQKLGLDAEASLRRANRKFRRRFGHVVARCHQDGIAVATAGLDRLEGYWQEAKRIAGGPAHPPGGAERGGEPSGER